ncbi:MAG: acyl-CoA dehydrogenase family protein [Actinomycetota bacterium]|jgi:alkylation response protein AidB-like acyl-CoA dehydrogenase|nr:acyl-CoA dehydrogenase family protein [Actinomycetota bacterium]MDA3015453.1 acyl-CoA dehydrogenase family protein [Actinomycetota bacterium]MDA3028043.1 acyl-CoA dehydrogenase family protein [Actinomycetota bacterium]
MTTTSGSPAESASADASTPGLSEFRDEVRAFFRGLPDAMAGTGKGLQRARAWRALLFDAGLAAIDYPTKYGGRGLGPEFVEAYRQLSQGLVPREETHFGIGIGMALPIIRDFGADHLKDRFLQPGLRGEEIWCQLYSEPGAGSDLAGLTTRAELDGDEWVVTGQKVWTSGAQLSQFGILLARTNVDAPKHQGITMFVLPMEQPGVTVRPLVQMTHEAEFNEVFMDEARIPADWVVGEVNGGWAMAVALLAHERVQTGSQSMGGSSTQKSKAGRVPIPVAQLIELARERDRADDPIIRQELARLHTGEKIVSLLRDRPGIHPSIGKLWRTKQGRAAAELAAQLAFPASPAWGRDLNIERNFDEDYFAFHILNCRGMSLGGGTDEIQRNTLGERALGLPREPGPDRDVPFRDLLKN